MIQIDNHDIICEHGALKQANVNAQMNTNTNTNSDHNNHASQTHTHTHNTIHSTRSSRAKRRLMDKQAWKVLSKITKVGECIQCTMETQTKKRNEEKLKIQLKEERKKPLMNVHVRKFYSRSRGGVPKDSLVVLDNVNMSSNAYSNAYSVNDINMHMNNISMNTHTPMSKKGKGSTTLSCPLKPGIYYVKKLHELVEQQREE
jgi:hypothetical protein